MIPLATGDRTCHIHSADDDIAVPRYVTERRMMLTEITFKIKKLLLTLPFFPAFVPIDLWFAGTLLQFSLLLNHLLAQARCYDLVRALRHLADHLQLVDVDVVFVV